MMFRIVCSKNLVFIVHTGIYWYIILKFARAFKISCAEYVQNNSPPPKKKENYLQCLVNYKSNINTICLI